MITWHVLVVVGCCVPPHQFYREHVRAKQLHLPPVKLLRVTGVTPDDPGLKM